ncbi:murein L,D-transpeptidase [Desulfopila sp. IMCC35008]|uniref:L,D-transpeptidase family protein n=1 Tax=Desulfopila sp. IMCC35008 TaxID=2653858 RepID=UPI0013D7994E|nr:L,D-transpeptidase family protein [Desulfopila sp. IMCC35008]
MPYRPDPTGKQSFILSRKFPFYFLLPLALLALLQLPANGNTLQIRKAMTKYLVCSPLKTVDITPTKSIVNNRALCLSTIYLSVNNYPLWVDEEGPTEAGWAIVHHLQNSSDHGLNPRKYEIEQIKDVLPSQTPEDLAQLETLLTFGLVKYLYDLHGEKDLPISSEAGRMIGETNNSKNSFDPVTLIKKCLEAVDFFTFLKNQAPSHYHYKGLQESLRLYQSIAAAGGWLPIPEGPPLKPGDKDSRIKAVKLRLLRTDLPHDTPLQNINSNYDDTLRRAVLQFQARHNLTTDGVIGLRTLDAMNIPVRDRLETVRLNLTRWHRQAHQLGERYILVNIADFTLRGIVDNETVLDIPVVVGNLQNQTPIFSDHVKYLVFNPYWTITPSIAKNEQLPALRKNPFHLVERHIRLFSSWYDDAIEMDSTEIDWYTITPSQMSVFRLRQDPGPWNSLGKLKFVFPNKHSIYLHDTPSQDLFSRDQRFLSHGCIRVSDPPALASFILDFQQKKFTPEMIQDLYLQNERKVIPLDTPVPVHITYQTGWVDKEGLIHFNKDVYARDQKLLHAVN